jgi:hypothetical protein
MWNENRTWLSLALVITISPAAVSLYAQQNSEKLCLVRKITVQVEDEFRNPVPGLTADSFKATIAGAEIAVRRAVPLHPPSNIVLLLDVSASRHDTIESRSSHLLETEIINQSPQGSRFAIVDFNEDTYFDQDFTSDRKLLWEAIQKYTVDFRGASSVYDSLIKSVDHIHQLNLSAEDSLIVLITDGEDDDSRNDLIKTEAILGFSAVRVFAIGTISSDPLEGGGSKRIRKSHEALERLAKTSGGISIWFWKEDPSKEFRGGRREYKIEKDFRNIHDIVAELIREMAGGYELEITLPAAIAKPAKWNLEIIDAEAKAARKITPFYPEALYPCSSGSKK